MRSLCTRTVGILCCGLAVALLFAGGPAVAQSETGLPLPRYVSLRADAVQKMKDGITSFDEVLRETTE